jgi:hypothetical protein
VFFGFGDSVSISQTFKFNWVPDRIVPIPWLQ